MDRHVVIPAPPTIVILTKEGSRRSPRDVSLVVRRSMNSYWVYIMTNRSGTLYIGVTNDLGRRVTEHRQRRIPGFTAKYRVDRLVHAEPFADIHEAITREKQLKGWTRDKKLALIAEANPEWRDLGDEWFGVEGAS